ncbi:MAG TPA: carbohydrate ABC transporter permease [Dehalococcoidia bacterium]|nr:carbohydrate ABC transporter permease [Dehalococcoidia bacterium]
MTERAEVPPSDTVVGAAVAGRPAAGAASALAAVGRRLPLHIAVVGIMIIWSVPTIALLVSSFRTPQAIASSGWWNAIREPLDFTLDNYETVLEKRGMGRAFVNSLIITVPSTCISIMVAAWAAYAFAWMRFPGRNTLFLIVVALLVVPLQMTLIPVLRLYTNITIEADMPIIGGRIFGTSSFAGMWLAHTAYGLPFAVYLLRNFFGGLPRDLLESAFLDGASDLRVFLRIVLPLSMPAIAALAIFQFLWIWNDLLVALVFLGDPRLFPMTVQIQSLVSSFGSNYQVLTAAAFVSMALPLAIFFALQRYFVQGVLAGAVKG